MTNPAALWTVIVCEMRDWTFRLGRPCLAFLMAFAAICALGVRMRRQSVQMLLTASRYTDGERFQGLLVRNLELIRSESASLCGPCVPLEEIDNRCLVLAAPIVVNHRVLRKGVLLVKFTDTAGKLYASSDHERLFRLFHLVLEPSWSGYADPSILAWLNAPEPVIVQSAERRDRTLLGRLSSNLVPVSYGSGDWIDPDRFYPLEPNQKLYHSICVANFGWWKRVHAFLKAVSYAKRRVPNYRCVLVLASLGGNDRRKRELQHLLSHYSIEDNVSVVQSISQEDLRAYYSRARVLVFPSWKEGSSRVIFEAMCADTPVLMLARNVGVNKDYINAKTGKMVPDNALGQELIQFALNVQPYAARRWYLDNLGPSNTTAKLAVDLAQNFPDENWKPEDLFVKANVPEARYVAVDVPPARLSEWLS